MTIHRRALLAGCAALVGGCGPDRIADRAPRLPKEGGIGGTGIVGTLTDFGSLMVNGQRVTLSRSTLYESAGGSLGAGDLRVGQSLTVQAVPAGSGLVAERVRLIRPLVGRVERVDGGLHIAGVPVRAVAGVAAPTEIGARVAVSGLWDGQRVVASLFEPADPAGPDLLSGTVLSGPDGLTIQGISLDAPLFALPPVGSFATVLGQAQDGQFQVDDVVGGRFFASREPLARLSVEGYLEPIPEAPGYAVSGLGHSMDGAAQLSSFAGTRVLLEGPYTGDFEPIAGLTLPEAVADRQRLLSAGFRLELAPGVRPAR